MGTPLRTSKDVRISCPCWHGSSGIGRRPIPSYRFYRFENWKRLRAPASPYFLRSFSRGSRVRKPAFFSVDLRVGSYCSKARAMPRHARPRLPLKTTSPATDVDVECVARFSQLQRLHHGHLECVAAQEVLPRCGRSSQCHPSPCACARGRLRSCGGQWLQMYLEAST